MKLTAIILSKGESTTQRALESVEFADELLVVLDTEVDFDSKNNSKVRVVRHELAGDYSQQRNFATTQAKGEWLLYLDSDEVLTKELTLEIQEIVKGSSTASCFYIKRRDFFWGKELKFGETKTARETGFIRLVKRNSGSWQGTVHEEFASEQKAGRLNGYIDHRSHQTIAEFLNSVNLYSSIRAKELKDQGKEFSFFRMLFYPIGKFAYTYFLKLGMLDGPAGFVYSFMMSFHSFLVQAKLLNL